MDDSNVYVIVLTIFTRSRCGFFVLLLVLVGKVLTDDEQDKSGSGRKNANYGEGNPIPWLVLRLPDEGSSSVTHRVGNQDYGIDCDALRVARYRHANPRKEDDEWGNSPDWQEIT